MPQGIKQERELSALAAPVDERSAVRPESTEQVERSLELRLATFSILTCWGVSFFFYYLTASRTIGFGDTAILIDAIESGHLSSHVNNHPFTVLMGWVFSCFSNAEPAFAANLVSVFFGSASVTVMFAIFRAWGASSIISAVLTLPVMVMHSLWWHSTIIENYAVSTFLTGLCYLSLLCFQRRTNARFLFLACFVAGLSIFNHVQNSFLCLGVAVCGCIYARSTTRPARTLVYCALGATAGLLPWALLLCKEALSGSGLAPTIKDAFVGKFEGTFFSSTVSSMISETSFIVWNQSPLLLLPLGGALGVRAYVRRFSWTPALFGILTHISLTFVVFSGYGTWDRFAFLLPGLYGAAFFAGIGLLSLRDIFGPKRGTRLLTVWCLLTTVTCPVLYGSVTTLALDPSSMWFGRFSNFYSANLYDHISYIANPNKARYNEVQKFADELFAQLPPNSTFLDDDSRTYYPLADYYQKLLKKRRDVRFLLVNSWGFSDWGLSGNAVGKILEDAYYQDKPFFVASTGEPYTAFFDQVKGRIPVSFAPFSISAGRWVYKLVTAGEAAVVSALRARELSSKGLVAPIQIAGAAGVVNLSLSHVLFSSSEGLVLQKMTNFGAEWVGGDHLFVSSSQPGAELQLYLVSPEVRSFSVSMFVTAAPDFGDIRVSMGEPNEGVHSLFSPIVRQISISLGSKVIGPEGRILTVRVVGKSDLSANYRFGLDAIEFK